MEMSAQPERHNNFLRKRRALIPRRKDQEIEGRETGDASRRAVMSAGEEDRKERKGGEGRRRKGKSGCASSQAADAGATKIIMKYDCFKDKLKRSPFRVITSAVGRRRRSSSGSLYQTDRHTDTSHQKIAPPMTDDAPFRLPFIRSSLCFAPKERLCVCMHSHAVSRLLLPPAPVPSPDICRHTGREMSAREGSEARSRSNVRYVS